MSEFSIVNHIRKVVTLNSEEQEALRDIVQTKKIKRRQFIVQPEFTCQYQSYIKKGAMRSYFISSEGTDHTIQFAVEDWWISDFYSYINQIPASLYVEALEDSEIEQISFSGTERLCQQFPVFERFFRIVAQKAFAYSQKRVLSNLEKTAEERYLEFNSMYPTITQRVPQYMLASYLGMSAEFLSKIRKKISMS